MGREARGGMMVGGKEGRACGWVCCGVLASGLGARHVHRKDARVLPECHGAPSWPAWDSWQALGQRQSLRPMQAHVWRREHEAVTDEKELFYYDNVRGRRGQGLWPPCCWHCNWLLQRHCRPPSKALPDIKRTGRPLVTAQLLRSGRNGCRTQPYPPTPDTPSTPPGNASAAGAPAGRGDWHRPPHCGRNAHIICPGHCT